MSEITAAKTVLPEPLTRLIPPKEAFHLDQFKNGALINSRPIITNRLIFGRAPDCDILLEHQSISRYHAALLWSPKNDDSYQKGENVQSFWYLVDIGSTHGTVCNKIPVEAGKMIKINANNNVFRFGASSRFFTLTSKLEDQEDMNESASQFQQHDSNLKKTNYYGEVEDGCSWGMDITDCDDEIEETADSVALKSIISTMKSGDSSIQVTANRDSYSDNPYKCLQQWFVQEGQGDFNYKVDQQSNGKFRCTLELPVDGQWIPIEGALTSKKKDAISDVCLKCCQILDHAQLLFPWQKQSISKKSHHDRDDDDDDGIDGMIDETKNFTKKHKKLCKKNETIINYETLNDKWKVINEELCKLKVRLATIGLEPGVTPEGIPSDATDSLDAYMEVVNKKKFGLTLNEKIEKSNIRNQIKQLEKEQTNLEKLIHIAKPAIVSVIPKTTLEIESKSESNNKVLNIEITQTRVTQAELQQNVSLTTEKQESANVEPKSTSTINQEQKKVSKSERVKIIRKQKQESIVQAIEKEKRLEKKNQELNAKIADETDPDYVGWVPPIGQSGDGKTHLNDKFGY